MNNVYFLTNIHFFHLKTKLQVQKHVIYGINLPISAYKSELFFLNGKNYVVKRHYALQIRADGDKKAYFVVETPIFHAI